MRVIHEIVRGRILFSATAAALLCVAISTNGLAGGCNAKMDFGQRERCFLHQFPCIVAYFGVDQPANYPRAFECFEHKKAWPFVVLMYLNGEGITRDLQQAESVLVSERKENPQAFSGNQASTLEAAISRCSQNAGKSCARTDYCKELAESTLDLEVCDAVDQVSEEAALSRTISSFENQLSPSGRATFEQVVAEFKAYQLAESRRVGDAVIPGTLYALAGSGQAAFVREDFMKLLAEIRALGKLEPITYNEYRSAEEHVWRAYREDIARTLRERQGIDKEYRWIIADYKEAAQGSQRHWVRLRDLLTKLVTSLSRNQAKGFDPAVALKFAVITTRLAELCNNPIGPSNCQDQTSAAPQLSP